MLWVEINLFAGPDVVEHAHKVTGFVAHELPGLLVHDERGRAPTSATSRRVTKSECRMSRVQDWGVVCAPPSERVSAATHHLCVNHDEIECVRNHRNPPETAASYTSLRSFLPHTGSGCSAVKIQPPLDASSGRSSTVVTDM